MKYIILFFSLCCFCSNAFAGQYYRDGVYQGSKYKYQEDFDRSPSGSSTTRYPAQIRTKAPNSDEGFINNGFYMGIRGAGSLYDIKGKDSKDDDNSQWTRMFSLAMGGRYNNFRIEGEYINRGSVAFHGKGYKNSFKSDSFMGNFYMDFLPHFIVTPYLSTGIGITKTKYNSKGVSNVSERKDLLTGSVGGGISTRLSDSTNVDLGYRYYISDKLDIYENDIYYHDVYIGFRYTF